MSSQFGNGNVIQVKEDSLFNIELERAGEKLVVVDFTASWCGPCQRIAPIYAQLSLKFLGVTFLKVDVDQCPFTAETNGIRAMPTFLFFRKKVKVGEVKGSDSFGLESKIKQLIEVPENHIIVDPKRVASGRSWGCFNELVSNDKKTFLATSDILLKFANNVLNNPEVKKYRCIRIENKIFQQKLLPVSGGVECLFAMGFEEDGDNLVLSSKTSLDAMKTLRDAIYDERSQKLQATCSSLPKPFINSGISQPSNPNVPSAAISTHQMTPAQLQFYAKLRSSSDHVMLYEEPELQRRARSYIPLTKLEEKAEKMSQLTKKEKGKEMHVRDCLLLVLLDWFKSEYFNWVDKPSCPTCNVQGQYQGVVPPTSEEERWSAMSVESYRCSMCPQLIRFPRYNSPEKLLETRQGRCGEWANCFTLFCRSLGYECRYVVDWTDHVWTEVYSEAQQRWLHCDSCELTCDKPLLYEVGWGKHLTYVIAFSVDQIVDVTWRYSANHEQVRRDRQEVSETWLADIISKMTQQLQKVLPTDRREMLNTRLMTELIEFMTPKTANKDELQGRISGSLAWRSMRGEMGQNSTFKAYVFKPTKDEIKNKRMRIRYSTASDKYFRSTDDAITQAKADLIGWNCGLNSVKSVFRKVEQDWNMAYLSRIEGTSSGELSWMIDISESGCLVDDVTIKVTGTTFANGCIEWTLHGENKQSQTSTLTGDGTPQTLFNLHGSKTLTLKAHLSGGQGDVAWQHAQLFRQSLNATNEYLLDIDINLINKGKE